MTREEYFSEILKALNAVTRNCTWSIEGTTDFLCKFGNINFMINEKKFDKLFLKTPTISDNNEPEEYTQQDVYYACREIKYELLNQINLTIFP